MATEIKIHRGGQIGGCVTEISTGKSRILIDFGEELPGSKNEEKFEFPWGERPVDAVFFTHYHGDHIGRFAEAYRHANLYMSELSWEVLHNIHGYLKDNLPRLAKRKDGEEAARILAEAEVHGRALDTLEEEDIPEDKKRIHTFRPNEEKAISVGDGDIRVTPFWVDHSAADACMLLIETEDKRILHTGDFRGHGSQGKGGVAMCEAVRRLAEERSIDSLIIEGTMMSRLDEEPYSEEDLFQSADRLFEEHKHIFLMISSTNLDSLQTFYRAAEKWELPVYVYNGYLKSQLETLGKYASQRWNMPAMEGVEQIKAQSPDQLKGGFVAVIKANEMGTELVRRFEDSHPVVVYSMWPGYYRRRLDTALCDFVEVCKKEHIPVYPLTDNSYGSLHTSGHASPKLITQVINAAKPSELFPIHTEDAWGFLRLDIPEKLKEALRNRMIQAGEEGGYSQEADHRYLSDASLAKFLPGQPYHNFVQLVKKHSELAFCFRGNSDDAAIVYYKNHAVFHITKSGVVKFNFDHARYMSDWRAKQNWLEQKGFSFDQKREPKRKERRLKNGKISISYSIGEVSMPAKTAKSLSLPEWEEISFQIRNIIDSFFAANQKEDPAFDQFRAEFSEDGEKRGTSRELTEKAVQQKLFLSCHTLESGYYIYDLEFAQPYGTLLNCKNQPDMLAIRFDPLGKPERLVLVEVKSRAESMDGVSGLKKHILGMEYYPDELLPVRGRDAYHILKQYIALGLMKEPSRPFIEAEFEKLSKEILLIFTGGAVAALKTAPVGEAPLKDFLQENSYQLLTGMFPSISLDGKHEEPMAVYRKDVKKGTA